MDRDIELLAEQLRAHRAVLCYTRDGAGLAWPHEVDPDLRRAVRNRRRRLALMLLTGDHRLCPAPDLHRSEWFYSGSGYVCPICRRLDVSQLGLWKKVS
jgi:hypothetical protein